MDTTKFKGYSNYATWRVQFDFFARMDVNELRDRFAGMNIKEASDYAEETVRRLTFDALPYPRKSESTPAELVYYWANAFLNEVNFREIAEHWFDYAGIEPRE